MSKNEVLNNKSQCIEFLYLQQEDCVKAGGLNMSEALKAAERAYFLHGKGDYLQPGKPVIRWGGPETEETTGRIMSMPSYLGGQDHEAALTSRNLIGTVDTAGIKYIPSRPSNPRKHGIPRANAVIIINDPETLMPMCIMDGTLVSAMRTGAASGVAAKYLAKKDSRVLGLVGASVQGLTQTMAMHAALPSLETVRIFDIDPEAGCRFSARAKAYGIKLHCDVVSSAKEAFTDSDVIVTATMAKAPYVEAAWYKPGALHCEISFWDTPTSALSVFDVIVVDDWYQVKHHGVDVSCRAVADGIIPESAIRGNLGDIVTGKKQGREDGSQRIFFNPIGMGILDLSEAHRIYCNAKANGIGTTLPLWNVPAIRF